MFFCPLIIHSPFLLIQVKVALQACFVHVYHSIEFDIWYFMLSICSRSEYVVYKLKEMGKVSEKDVMQISNNFDRLDTGKCGKITLADLLQNHH